MKIGITQRVLTYNNVDYDSLSLSWYDYLKDHNLTVISNRLDQDLEQLSNTIDLLIISGGNNHPIRDQLENILVRLMVQKGKPIIGVCHGIQMLTKFFGGEIGAIDDHHNTEHIVEYNNTNQIVNSFHTNKISKLPLNATVLATDSEGNCESWIKGNVGGVMWHPERGAWLPKELKELMDEKEV